jgi:hypothetical protein
MAELHADIAGSIPPRKERKEDFVCELWMMNG